MKIFDVVRMAFKNLFRSKVRTILTVLGIVIGTTAIIIMLSLVLLLIRHQGKWQDGIDVLPYTNYEKLSKRRGRW